MTPGVSIVVPFYNRCADVEPCLRSLQAQKLSAGRTFEIVAVDNGSTDGTLEALRRAGVRVFTCSRRGPAAARNEGLRHARGEIVAFTDSDCIAEPGWLADLIRPFHEQQDVVFSGGPILARTMRPPGARFVEEQGVLDQWLLFSGAPGFPSFFATANAAFRSQAIRDAGGFDESLIAGEDADLCWRIVERGGSIAYCHKAIVRHRHRATFGGLYRWAFGYGESGAAVFAKHRRRMAKRARYAWNEYPALAAAPVRCFLSAIRGKNPYEIRRPLYEAVWRTGYLLGRWRGSIRYRVPFL